MKVEFYDSEFDIPDLLIEKFMKDFEGLPGRGLYQEVNMLRNSIGEVIDVATEDPELLDEPEYRSDFIRALAMKKAMERHGIFYDA